MNSTIKLLDKYREVCSLSSDNAVAVKLGLSRSAVSLWRGGKGHPEADSVEKMCVATGENIARWMPLIEAERARSPSARKAWLRCAQLAAAVALTVGLVHPAPAQAHARLNADNPSNLYIMSTWKRIRRAIGTAVALLRSPSHGTMTWCAHAA